jgi:hypothetical protein
MHRRYPPYTPHPDPAREQQYKKIFPAAQASLQQTVINMPAKGRSSQGSYLRQKEPFLETVVENTWLLVLLADFEHPIKDYLIESIQYAAKVVPPEATEADEAQHEDEAQRRHNARQTLNVTPWSPSNVLLRSLAYQGPHRDSQANLYALAVLAHQYGHSEFIVADELTKCKLAPEFDPEYESGSPSGSYAEIYTHFKPDCEVIVISVHERDVDSRSLSVWARRIRIRDPVYNKRHPQCNEQTSIALMFAESHGMRNSQAVAIPGAIFPASYPGYFTSEIHDRVFEDNVWDWHGLELHDPDCPMLTPDTVGGLEWKCRRDAQRKTLGMALPNLPKELIYDIVDRIGVAPPVSLPIWEKFPSKNHLVIFVSFSMAKAEQERTMDLIDNEFERHFGKKRLQGFELGSGYRLYSESDSSYDEDDQDEWSRPPKTPEMTFELIPWERHGATSRRDFMNLWLEYYASTVMFQGGGRPPLHILAEPITNIRTPHFVELLADNKSVAVASRTTLDTIITVTKRDQNLPSSRFRDLHIPSSHNENLIVADQPFCRVRLSWQCAVLQAQTWIPAFYLTSRLTEEQVRDIRIEIKSPYGDDGDYDAYMEVSPKDCGFVPWKDGESDGTIRDIWEIAQMVHKESLWRGNDFFICIDQQSAIDKKVILVVPDHRKVRHRWPRVKNMYLPNLAGFTFARIPGRRSHTQGAGIHHFHSDHYEFPRKRFLRPELLRMDRLEADRRYEYVDGEGKPLELTEDVDSEASPTDRSNVDDEENESIDSLDALAEDIMLDTMYGTDFY